ncbi:MAG: beta-ketoacyl-[acyl-carrier-protein] synthase family protein [Methylococcales bacterium]|jgi:3-oxoacyl-[acyl-carrier-protein] synthase I|nr:beta-ketoacyl-[acyl-carrier-protein] synthase family protein [Methylococcales bacterium]MBT7443539.1 beta-ketoacyl-[acyl-carrier-protein] synthase family protein [Methylococcales bacterium]
MKQNLKLSSLGIISALGSGTEETAQRLMRGDLSGMVKRPSILMGGEALVGEVADSLPCIPEKLSQYASRNNQILLAVMLQIMPDIERVIEQYGADRVAVILGSSTSGVSVSEQALSVKHAQGAYPGHFNYQQQEMGSASAFLAEYCQLTNVALTISTACSSSGKVFASARRMVESGMCDAVLVGGVDSLCQLTVNGFSALESVSSEHCNPFSQNRKGINIGEGAALFVLEKGRDGIQLMGVGESSDAHHMSAPHPEGDGAEASMRHALTQSGLKPEQIGYLNLHGTATEKNDEMESYAVARVFSESLYCSSTKPMTGHTLGAAGAIELAFCWLTLSDDNTSAQLPPHLWDGVLDPNLSALNFVAPGQSLPENSQYAMSSTFAFGGSNVSVVIGREK